MSSTINTQIRLASRPTGWVSAENFKVTEEPVAEPGEGQVLVRNVFMSVDPYMRGRMNDVKSYVPPFRIDEVLQASAVGEVVDSRYEGIKAGDYVTGMLGWENYSVCDGRTLRQVHPGLAPLSYHLGILGMPGMTAYVGLMQIAKVRPGDTVFVSAASGAVGSIVGQLASICGCRAVGSAGSDDRRTPQSAARASMDASRASGAVVHALGAQQAPGLVVVALEVAEDRAERGRGAVDVDPRCRGGAIERRGLSTQLSVALVLRTAPANR